VRTNLACHTVTSGIEKRLQFLKEQQQRKEERESLKLTRSSSQPTPRGSTALAEHKPATETETETEVGTGTRPETVSGTESESSERFSCISDASLLTDAKTRAMVLRLAPPVVGPSNCSPTAQVLVAVADAELDAKVEAVQQLASVALPACLGPLPVGLLPTGTFAEVVAAHSSDAEDERPCAGRGGEMGEGADEETLPEPLPVGLLPVGTILPPVPPSRYSNREIDRARCGHATGESELPDGQKGEETAKSLAKISTEYSVVTGALQIRWVAETKRLHAVSPLFELSFGLGLPTAQFKLVLASSPSDGSTPWARGYIQVKCITSGLPASLPQVHLRVSVGATCKPLSVFHNFGENTSCTLNDEEWDLVPAIDVATQTIAVCLEILPHHIQQVPNTSFGE